MGSKGSIEGSPGNGSEVLDWVKEDGDLSATKMDGKGDINITLSNDITVTSDVGDASLPTMGDVDGRKYFFDFTDGRFDGKTITIDGQDKTIKIDNAGLFFLNLKDCRVILKNITIDGGWIKNGDVGTKRSGSFIYVTSPTGGSESELEIEEGAKIQNCANCTSASAQGCHSQKWERSTARCVRKR